MGFHSTPENEYLIVGVIPVEVGQICRHAITNLVGVILFNATPYCSGLNCTCRYVKLLFQF